MPVVPTTAYSQAKDALTRARNGGRAGLQPRQTNVGAKRLPMRSFTRSK
jgi:hypothetical protein